MNVWHVPSSGRIASLSLQSKTAVDAMPVPGTDVVVVLTESTPAILWNTTTQERMMIGDTDDLPLDVDVHPTDGSIALGLQNGRCLIVNAVTGTVSRTLAS